MLFLQYIMTNLVLTAKKLQKVRTRAGSLKSLIRVESPAGAGFPTAAVCAFAPVRTWLRRPTEKGIRISTLDDSDVIVL